MALQGLPGDGLLEHADGCTKKTFTKCEAVVIERPVGELAAARREEIEVVRMEWCADCGAADYEVV